MKTVHAAAFLCALAVSALAQDQPKPPFEWKTEGDTIETFKATLVVNQKVDQSTARGAVEAYLGFTDGRDDSDKEKTRMARHWDAIAAKGLASWEEKLLSAEARTALAEARKENAAKGNGRSRVAPATEIKTETKAEDGGVVVETLQKITDKYPDKTGKMNEHTREEKQRFTCIKGDDGKWRINRIEQWTTDWDTSDSEKIESWKASAGMLAYMFGTADAKAAEPAEPKQDTPENAALSLYTSLIARRDAMQEKAVSLGRADWFKHVEALLTPAFVEAAKKEGQEVMKGMTGALRTASGTEAATDGKDGAKIVKFKKSDTWRTDVQATVKQVDGKWVVVEAGIWENVGGIDVGPRYRAMGDIYKLPKP